MLLEVQKTSQSRARTLSSNHQPEEVFEGEPEDADGFDEGEAGVVLCLVVGRVAGEEEGGTNIFYQKLSKNPNLESEGNLCLMLGIVFRVIPTVETTTKMKEMKETACW